MTQSLKVIQFGRFQLDSRSNLLFRDGEELALEPKLVEVLQYLLDNRDRYVPLSELHDEVWAGRVVTDTAVRRTISKLRQALDDDVNEPVYIKSLPKRGYRLIIDIAYIEEDSTTPKLSPEKFSPNPHIRSILDGPQTESNAENDSNTASAVANSSIDRGIPENIATTQEARDKRSKGIVLIAVFSLAVVALVALRFIIPWHQTPNPSFELSKPVILNTMKTTKLGLTATRDGKYLAYSARQSSKAPFQVFLQDLSTGDIKPITFGKSSVTDLQFVLGGKAIAFAMHGAEGTELRLVRLDSDSAESSHLLGAHYFNLGNIEEDSKSGGVFFPLYGQANTATIYRMDLNTGETNEVTFSERSDTIDYLIAVSPAGDKYSFVRGSPLQSNISLYIFDKATDELLHKINWQPLIIDIAWIDENNCLILDKENLSVLDMRTKKVTPILKNEYQLITRVEVSGPDKFLILKTVPADKEEISVSIDDFSDRSRLNLSQFVVSSSYHFENDKRFWVMREPEGYSLNVYETSTGTLTPLLDSVEKFKVFDLDLGHLAILLSVNGRLAVYFTPTKEISYLTNQSQFVEDARFTESGSKVLFGEKHVGGWRISEYELTSHKSTPFLQGYRSLRQFASGYIAADPNGALYRLNADKSVIEPLGIELAFGFVTAWDISGEKLIWSEIIGDETKVTVKDLRSGELTVLTDDLNAMNADLNFSMDRKSFSYRALGNGRSDIIEYQLQYP